MLFNLYWFVCVVFPSEAWFLLVVLLVAAAIFDKSIAYVAPCIALVGLVVDSTMTGLGIYFFEEPMLGESFVDRVNTVPFWLVFLWLGFGSYAWLMKSILLKQSMLIMVLLCAISGTTSYHAASRLGAVSFVDNFYTTLMLVLVWAFYGWLFTRMIAYFNEQALRKAIA